MRSLALLSTDTLDLGNAHITQQAYDAEHDILFLCSEATGDSSCDIDIIKVEKGETYEQTPIATFPISSSSTKDGPQAVSLKFLGETQSLCIITSSGDIGIISLEDDSTHEFDIVGSIDAGIKSVAWNPDESLVAIITGENRLLLMTNTFDAISESALETTEEGEGQQVNVGWGSKKTQFHGSLGKAAAQESSTQADKIGLSPDDDQQPRISWRGDGSFVVISSIDHSGPRPRRTLRVYDRQGVLQNVSEPIAGLEHVLSWRPSGNLIASTQRFGFEGGGAGKVGRHDLVFFERNGLRHGEFAFREPSIETAGAERRWGYKVKELLWNCDSNILGIWIEGETLDSIQLWTIGNYHWYLKQEILADDDYPRFSTALWHPEKPMRLSITSSKRFFEYEFTWETFISRSPPPNDSGCVAVVDGTNLLLTPFRTQNVPPPMSTCQLSTVLSNGHPDRRLRSRTPLHISFSSSRDAFALLHHRGIVQVWDLRTRFEPGRGKAMDPVTLCEFVLGDSLPNDSRPRQIILTGRKEDPTSIDVAVLASNSEHDLVARFSVANALQSHQGMLRLPSLSGRLLHSSSRVFWQSASGAVFEVIKDGELSSSLCQFPEFCVGAEAIELPDDEVLFVVRSGSSNLYVVSPSSSSSHKLASGTTSFVVSGDFVIYTTASHEAFFAPIQEVQALLSRVEECRSKEDNKTPEWERRRVERGSIIVTSVPSAMTLVLQMPRGNLETVNPRPLVLAVVRQDIDALKYRKAFIACRKHRIDLNIIFEHNPQCFLQNVGLFIDQIEEVDFLNLFLTSIGQSTLPPKDIAEICDAVRTHLEGKDLTKYVNTILTAHVSKKPADYEAGLSLLLRLRDMNADLVEEAVKYIIFLVDADKLFDTALGMYDFSLVLLIAQHSQKDPREYLPFLRELRALPKYYQRFRIDDHLKRHQSALQNIHLGGPEYFEEAMRYVEMHHLYLDSLAIWKGDSEPYARLLELYGDWMFDRREYDKAALVYIEGRNHSKALVAYERALMWRELFTLAAQDGVEADTIKQIAFRVADELSSKKRFDEAAVVLMDYGKDVRGSVQALAHGNSFTEARRIISIHGEVDLIAEILYPASLEARHQFSEDLEEMQTQLDKQVQRVQELRVKQVEEPDAFYGVEDENLHNVDVMTDVSMAATAFTRYTAAPSAMSSRASKRSSRSKRKMDRKVGSGKKGTVDEEEYLLNSITKLFARFKNIETDAGRLIPNLVIFSDEHRAEAKDLQVEILRFREALVHATEVVWPFKPEESENRELDSYGGDVAAMIQGRMAKRRFAVEQILKPTLPSSDWKHKILDL